jgi:CheY-like chemotaxis protein
MTTSHQQTSRGAGLQAAPTVRRSGRALRALLVDDDTLLLAVLTDLLKDLGTHDVKTAASGAEAATAFDRMLPPPDLILCDLKMPDGDGFQFMEMLASRKFAGAVVLVSGMEARVMNSASLMARFHRLSVLATLSKPVSAAALGAALAKLT